MKLGRKQIDRLLKKLEVQTRESKYHISGWISYQGKLIQPIHFSKNYRPIPPKIQKKFLRSLKLNASEFEALYSCHLSKDDYFERFTERQEIDGSLELFEPPSLIDVNGKPISKDDDVPSKFITVTQDIKDELLVQVANNPELMYQISPREFELFVSHMLTKQGFDVRVTPASKDGGKDLLVAAQGELGNFMVYVECKSYAKNRPVGVEIVRELYGTIEADRVTAGLIATTSTFTKGAREFQRTVKHRMELADYFNLIDWLEKALCNN